MSCNRNCKFNSKDFVLYYKGKINEMRLMRITSKERKKKEDFKYKDGINSNLKTIPDQGFLIWVEITISKHCKLTIDFQGQYCNQYILIDIWPI